MKIAPLRNQVFATRDNYESLTAAGVVIPDSAQESPIRAIVTAVGPGRLLENGTLAPMTVMVGDKIVFDPRGVIELRITQTSAPVLCMEETSIVCVLREGLELQ